jgi:hypothetical protein
MLLAFLGLNGGRFHDIAEVGLEGWSNLSLEVTGLL